MLGAREKLVICARSTRLHKISLGCMFVIWIRSPGTLGSTADSEIRCNPFGDLQLRSQSRVALRAVEIGFVANQE